LKGFRSGSLNEGLTMRSLESAPPK